MFPEFASYRILGAAVRGPTLPDPSDTPTMPVPDSGNSTLPDRLGPYQIEGEIARGGMGIVYRARHVELGRVVALKILLAGEHASPESIERLRREALAAARLDHPNVVRVYEVGQEGPRAFIAMEHIDGEPLSRLLRRGEVPLPRALDLLRKVALALDAAHAIGILHRDVKSANILVGRDGEPRLADFGLARDLSVPGITATGAMLGTPSYASPEQASGAPIDARSDVYSLGATMYEVLTGRPPFVGEAPYLILVDLLSKDPTPPRKLKPDVPIDVETVCLKALEKDPSRRYASARALAEDLARCAAGEPVTARPRSSIGVLMRRLSRNRAAVVPIALALAAVLGIVGWRLHVLSERTEALHAARSHVAQGEFVEARDGLRSLLAVHPDAADAARLLSEVERQLATREADRATVSRLADESAAAAERVMTKARLVAAVFTRWARLREALGAMERRYYDSSLSPEETRSATEIVWKDVAAFVSATPDDPTSRATMLALSGWARRLAGFEEEGLARMREAAALDPEVPYGALMEALAHFSTYVECQDLPSVASGRAGREAFSVPAESPKMTAVRERFQSLIAQASQARVWGEEGARDLSAAMEGFRSAQGLDLASAEEAVTRAIDAPDLAAFVTGLRYARAHVRYLRRDWPGALEDDQAVLDARPRQVEALLLLASIRQSQAEDEAASGRDPSPLLGQAREAADRALAVVPTSIPALSLRSGIAITRADWQRALGQDPRTALAEALAGYEAAIAISDARWELYLNRANAILDLGVATATAGGDPRREYEKAISDLGEVLRREPDQPGAYANRAGVWLALAQWQEEHRVDPCGAYEKSIADAGAAIERKGSLVSPWGTRSNARRLLGKVKEARGEDPRDLYKSAIADAGEGIRVRPEFADLYIYRGMGWKHLGRAEKARGGSEREAFARAIEDYVEGARRNPSLWQAHSEIGSVHAGLLEWEGAVAAFEKALAGCPGQPMVTAFLQRSLVELARVEAGRSAKAAGEEGVKLRDAAFARLRRALDLGLPEKERLAADPALAPLRDDPRWKDLVR